MPSSRPARSRLAPVLFISAVTALAALAPNGEGARAAPSSPDLDLARRLAAPGELIPVTIVMAEQADVATLLPIARGLSRPERRAFAVSELKHLAAATQGRVLEILAAAERRGEAAAVLSLWIANGVRARATSAVIGELLALDEVRIVLWDPPIAPAEAEDTTEPPRPVPAAGGGPAAGGPTIWWQLDYVRAPEVWDLGYRGDGIVIAVLDSGVDRFHPDLATHIWNNEDEIPFNGVDDDQNGYIDDTWGWDFSSNDNDPSPSGAHGTNCAGIAAGDGTNGTATGVAPLALVMSCKVNTWTQNIAGIQYAIDNGADVITMSRSQKWRFTPKPDYDWWRANTDNELLAGIFHANSIGNEGDNQNTDPIPFNIAAPGSCPSPWLHPDQVQAGVSAIMGCGAIDQFDVIAPYSSRGPFAWEDIAANWPEYPYSMRPEYQDYPWSGGLPGLLKPDAVAPGPNTRTTHPGGGYVTFSGTSAATPHVAGAMALCLEANPDLMPEQMAMVIQAGASDLGDPGKDNTFGAGKLDCFEAVQLALSLSNLGTVRGTVTDTGSEAPIEGVLVEVENGTESTLTDASGNYELTLQPETYTLRFSNFHYHTATAPVTVTPQAVTILDIALDLRPAGALAGRVSEADGGPVVAGAQVLIEETPIPAATSDAGGDYSFASVPASSYFVTASAFGYRPELVPVTVVADATTTLDFSLMPALFASDLETDPGWQAGVPGDTALGGVWVRVDPNGTAAQPEDDHTPDPGTQCFVTGQGTPGGPADEADVEAGATTLRTAAMDLSGVVTATLSYWRWYSNDQGGPIDDEWVVQISSDGGSSWVDLERTGASSAAWTYQEFEVGDYVALTNEVVLQFIASDFGFPTVVEAGVDDVQILVGPAAGAAGDPAAAAGAAVRLLQNHPNPFNPATAIPFELGSAGRVTLGIYDVRGRLVRTLAAGRFEAGAHAVPWDGRDDRGAAAPSGIYVYRLSGAGGELARRMVLLK